MSQHKVTIYTKPNCGQCVQTKNAFKMKGLTDDDINEVDLTKRPELIPALKEKFKALSAPIVETPDGSGWFGFNMAKINEFFAAQEPSPCTI